MVVRVAVAVTAVALIALDTAPATAEQPPTLVKRAQDLGLSCVDVETYKGFGTPSTGWMTKCSGELHTHHAIKLDVVLMLPPLRPPGLESNVEPIRNPVPLVLLQPGWGGQAIPYTNDEIGDRYPSAWHWLSPTWAAKGYATLSFTPRGFGESCGRDDDDAGCEGGETHIGDRDWEVEDAKRLLGTMVDAGIAHRRRLAATGGSYGAGLAWMLATSPPWKSALDRELQLAAAIPMTGWTDLHDALLPNGRATTATTGRPGGEPIGVLKESTILGLYYAGHNSGARYASTSPDLGANLTAALAIWQAGEPYVDGAAAVEDAWRRKSARYNTDYLQQVRERLIRPVPILAVNGWTDDLVGAHQSVEMYQRLRLADPNYPIGLVLADVGHAPARESLAQWMAINEFANAFLDKALAGKRPDVDVRSLKTTCAARGEEPSTTWHAAQTWAGLSPTTITRSSQAPAFTSWTPPVGGLGDDPTMRVVTAQSGCIVGETSANAATWSWEEHDGLTVVGMPSVSADYVLSGTDATVIAKLWDVAPGGQRLLITQGAYRLTSVEGLMGQLSFELNGNHWTVPSGHSLQLELRQSDAPHYRPDNLASSITWTKVSVAMPLAP